MVFSSGHVVAQILAMREGDIGTDGSAEWLVESRREAQGDGDHKCITVVLKNLREEHYRIEGWVYSDGGLVPNWRVEKVKPVVTYIEDRS